MYRIAIEKLYEWKCSKSLKIYRERLSIRVSVADYKKEDWLVNLPLYAIENITVE